jgi:hypothetical protein
MDQAAFLIELADDLRERLSRSADQNDFHTLISKASGCYVAHAGTGAGAIASSSDRRPRGSE